MSQILEVTSNGLSGNEWITHLEKSGCHISIIAKKLLGHKRVTPTKGVTYRFAVITGRELEAGKRTFEHACAEAIRRGYLEPTAECAPLLRELVSFEMQREMGIKRLIVMHKHLRDPDTNQPFLFMLWTVDGSNSLCRWLDAFMDIPDSLRSLDDGFVFLSTPPSDRKNRQE